jgi:5-methylcytosine-specific restriction enzyme subunit McrC
MTTLTLTEWKPQTVSLEHEQASALRGLHPGLDVRWAGPDAWTVTSNGVVGAARTAGVDLVVEPGLPIARVLWLLSHAMKAPFLDVDAALTTDKTLLEAFVEMYLRSLRAAMRRGLKMGYRTIEEPLMTIRGRIRVTDQMRRHFGMIVPAEVMYDDYTADTEANQLLKAALRRLALLPIRTEDIRRRLAAATASFATVSDVRFDPGRLPRFTFSRLTEDYRTPLALAALVIRSTSVDIKSGRTEVPGLLFDMWRVFQDFLFEALSPHLPSDFSWRSEERLYLDDAAIVALRPDFSLWSGSQCVAVGDAKYKRTAVGENDDLYQLLSYCVATRVEYGLLIYGAGPRDSIVHQVRHSGPQLEVIGIDLAAREADIEKSLASIAARLAPAAAPVAA